MAQIILASGLQRSGTTLIHRLLDGHSQLWVMPIESALNANKYLFPNFAASVANHRFNLSYEFDNALPVWNFFRAATLKKYPKSFEVDNPDFDFDFDAFLNEWRNLMESEAHWTETKILETYLQAVFANLNSHPRRNSDRYVLKTPRLGFHYRRFFELCPDGRLIIMARKLESYVGSEVRRSGVEPNGSYNRARRLKLIANLCRLHKFASNVIAELSSEPKAHSIDFNDLTADVEGQMRKVAGFLEIEFEEILTVPTAYGEPWISNSSFREERTGTRGRVVHRSERQQSLTKTEQIALKLFDRMLPPAAASTVFSLD